MNDENLPCPFCGFSLTIALTQVDGTAFESGRCPECSREYDDAKLDEIRVKPPTYILAEDSVRAARRLGRPGQGTWAAEQLRNHAIHLRNGGDVFPISKIREYAAQHGITLVPSDHEAWLEVDSASLLRGAR
jgi:hypothetical protein